MDPDEYCREIEAYLCRRNEGHLVRIVGPSFERVVGWAAMGIPLKVAFKGIDRYAERYYAKGPRRRPLRVDFCEADVLDVFDEWRRAVGLSEPGIAASAQATRPARSLPAHLDRVIVRLTACRAGGRIAESLDRQIERTVRELDAVRAGGRALRGEARQALIARLEELDRDLLDEAVRSTDPATLAALDAEAERELTPFRDRMPAGVLAETLERARRRLLRDRLELPTLMFD